MRPSGHTIANARPTTVDAAIVPWWASSMWQRESADMLRWSPMTHRRPWGTFTGPNSREVQPASRRGLFSKM
jgi:hypothetical protein